MLTRIALKDFKSFAEVDLPIAPFTLLVGANASGKSNLLDAIRFLQGLALGHAVDETLYGKREGGQIVWTGIRGGSSNEVARIGSAGVSTYSVWQGPHWESGDGASRTGAWRCGHFLRTRTGEAPGIVHESLWTGRPDETAWTRLGAQEPLVADWAVRGPPDAMTSEGSLASEFNRAAARSLSLTSTRARHQDLDDDHTAMMRSCSDAMRSILFFVPMADRMTAYVPRAARLGENGDGLAAVLYRLASQQSVKDSIVGWLQYFVAPELQDIDFILTEDDHVKLVLVEKGGVRVTASAASDGTLRYLALLASLHDAWPGETVVIEEIEAGLHPARLYLLVQAIEQHVKHRGVQVIATTHSPQLLAELSEERLQDVIAFGRSPLHEGTVAKPVRELRQSFGEKDFDALLKKRGIDRLFTNNWLEGGL